MSATLSFDQLWDQQVAKELKQLGLDVYEPWRQLFVLGVDAKSRSAPSKRWSKQATELVGRIGIDAFGNKSREWIAQFLQLEANMAGRHAPSFRAVIWACASQEDAAIFAALGALAAHCFDKISEYGQRSTLLGNACLWTLSTVATDAGVAQLFELRNQVAYSSTQKLIDKALQRAADKRDTEISVLRGALAASSHERAMNAAATDMQGLSETEQATALLAQIYQTPSDDHLRQVYADSLLNLGDTLGEFIGLQYLAQPNRKQQARERALLKQHRTEWLGELEPIMYKKDLEFERGFPYSGRIKSACKKPLINRVVGHPRWATFGRLDLDCSSAVGLDFLTDPVMKTVTRLVGVPIQTAELLLSSKSCPAFVELGLVSTARREDIATVLRSASLPNLRRLELNNWGAASEQRLEYLHECCKPFLASLEHFGFGIWTAPNFANLVGTVLAWPSAPRTVRVTSQWCYTITRDGSSCELLVTERSQTHYPETLDLLDLLTSTLAEVKPGMLTALRISGSTHLQNAEHRALVAQVERLVPPNSWTVDLPLAE